MPRWRNAFVASALRPTLSIPAHARLKAGATWTNANVESRLAHLTERASEIKTARGLIVPPDIAMRDRPLLYLRGLSYRFAEGGAREAVGSFVSSDPDQVPVKFHEYVFRRAAPPRFVLVDITVARWDEPRDLLRGGGVREVENSEAGVKP